MRPWFLQEILKVPKGALAMASAKKSRKRWRTEGFGGVVLAVCRGFNVQSDVFGRLLRSFGFVQASALSLERLHLYLHPQTLLW